MKEIINDMEHTRAVLKWTKAYREYWRMICTPKDERMTPDTMKRIIANLREHSLYELIFVMLTVHRDTPFVNDLLTDISNYTIYRRWNKENEGMFDRIMNYL